jgi:cytochrome P450
VTSAEIDIKAAARLAKKRVEHTDVPIPRDRRRDVSRPPGPSSLRALHGMAAAGVAPGFMVDIERTYSPMAHMRLMGDHLYVLTDPAAIVGVFIAHGRETMKGRGLQGVKAVVGNGLLTSDGEAHLRNRRLVQPAFHRDRIAAYAADMGTLTEAHESTWEEGRTLDMQTDMSALTLAIVGRTLFGADLSGDTRQVGEALTDLLDGMGRYLALGPRVLSVPLPGRDRALAASVRIDEIVHRIIEEHRAAGDTGDMLSLLISAQEDGLGFSDAQVRDEAVTLVLAGHETTAMTLTWTWMLLSQHPERAEWLHEELDTVLAGRTPTMADMERLPRTRAVVAESIRLYPPVWLQGRRLLADADVLGWTVPEGALALASQFALHRSPRWWESSLSFRPQRWIDASGHFSEEAPGQPRGAWFPFGWGNRRCIGEQFAWTEATLVMATLAQRWSPRLVPGTDVQPMPAVTLRTRAGMPMTLHRR